MFLPKIECEKCGYQWVPRIDDPKKCPKCGWRLMPDTTGLEGLMNALNMASEQLEKSAKAITEASEPIQKQFANQLNRFSRVYKEIVKNLESSKLTDRLQELE